MNASVAAPLTRFEPDTLIFTSWLFEPVTWNWADWAPVASQVTLAAAPQVTVPAWLIETLSSPVTTIVPKCRSRVAASVSGLTMLTRALATGGGRNRRSNGRRRGNGSDGGQRRQTNEFGHDLYPHLIRNMAAGRASPPIRGALINLNGFRLCSMLWFPDALTIEPKRARSSRPR